VQVLKLGYEEDMTDITITGTEANNQVAKKMIEEAVDQGSTSSGSEWSALA